MTTSWDPTAATVGVVPTEYERFLSNRQPIGKSRSEQKRANRRHRRLIRIFAYCLFPIVLCIRLLRPFVLVRFGELLRHKIGHCPLEAEFYLLERAAGLQPRKAIDLFYFDIGTDNLAANLFAEHLVRRNLLIHKCVHYLSAANDLLPGAEQHRVAIQYKENQRFADFRGLLRRYPQQIVLQDREKELGTRLLEMMGVPRGAPFICFHVRESTYWTLRRAGQGSDSDYRDSHIENYIDAMTLAAERGYYVLRVGSVARQPLKGIHPKIIDYTTDFRNEFMDVFLASTCYLMVSTGSGIDSISYMNRRPILLVNLVNWGGAYVGTPQPYDCIFKLFMREGNLLTFDEITRLAAQEFVLSSDFENAGLSLCENSSEEIRDALSDMLDQLENKLITTEDDLVRQERMRAYIRRSSRYRDSQFNVSPSFLRKYEILL